MAKKKSPLTHLSGKGKRKTACKLAAKYRKSGHSQKAAMKKAWSDLRKGGFLS